MGEELNAGIHLTFLIVVDYVLSMYSRLEISLVRKLGGTGDRFAKHLRVNCQFALSRCPE